MDEYNNAQDKWISDGLNEIRFNTSKDRKNLAKAFLEFAEKDLTAYYLLKCDSKELSIFHLQQAAEKIAKSMLILDMKLVKYDEIKNHDFIYILESLIEKNGYSIIKNYKSDFSKLSGLENNIFRQAITYTSDRLLNFLKLILKLNNTENSQIYKESFEKFNEIINCIKKLKNELNASTNKEQKDKLINKISKKERDLQESGIFTSILKNKEAVKKIRYITPDQIKSLTKFDNEQNSSYLFKEERKTAFLLFSNIILINTIMYPFESITRYPNKDGSIPDYENMGIFKASDIIIEKLRDMINQIYKLNLIQ